MSIRTRFLLVLSHLAVAAIGFAAGIYALPILIAPPPPTIAEVTEVAADADYSARFRRDLTDSDALHWGEGEVAIGSGAISLMGRLAPGPDYKLYLSPEFVDTEVAFNALKQRMVLIGDVKTFENFLVPIPSGIDPANYTTVVVWCETFGEFITAAEYKAASD